MKYIYTFSALMVLLLSCTKEKSKSELIIGDWQIAALTVDPPQIENGVVITDLYAQMEDCDKDNYYSFYTNNTYKFDQGAIICDSLEAQNISGNWNFVNDETELQLIYQSDTLSYTLIDLDEEVLKMSYSGRDSNNILHTLTVTFEPL
ncbi:MAG: hypothetical protein POELPBGB_00167 [Bacteroidia bacterium]|nr:hypothetical protein [Bacteroidia bacterium]